MGRLDKHRLGRTAVTALQLLLLFWIMSLAVAKARHQATVLTFLLWAIAPVVLIVRGAAPPSAHPVLFCLDRTTAQAMCSLPSELRSSSSLALPCVSFILSGGTSIGFETDAYRQYLAAGGAPSHYLLKYYQAYIYAPVVEETVFRGFLWRGLGGVAARQLRGMAADVGFLCRQPFSSITLIPRRSYRCRDHGPQFWAWSAGAPAAAPPP